jgi:hypothetical protein
MCLICVDIAKGTLTAFKAKQNLNEMVIGKELDRSEAEHVEEVLDKISNLELLERTGSM